MQVVVYGDEHFDGVARLWRRVFADDPPWNAAAVAIPEKRRVQPELLFVATEGEAVIGTAMAGYDGHRGWLYSVAVDPAHRRRGIASALVDRAERALTAAGCVKLNLQIRAGNDGAIAFYESLGYAVEPRVSMGKRLASEKGS